MELLSQNRLKTITGSVTAAIRCFRKIDGEQRAAAFAYYAFFSLLPLTIVSITVASLFLDRVAASEIVLNALDGYMPLDSTTKGYVFDTITRIVSKRAQIGLLAFGILLWSAVQFFKALIRASNRARGVTVYNWWRLRLKSLLLLTLAVLVAALTSLVPVLMEAGQRIFSSIHNVAGGMFTLITVGVSIGLLFVSVCLFYMLGSRQTIPYREVWPAALMVTVVLRLLESLFSSYLQHVSQINVIYGAFGGLLGFLFWLYLIGGVLIFGACICATQKDAES